MKLHELCEGRTGHICARRAKWAFEDDHAIVFAINGGYGLWAKLVSKQTHEAIPDIAEEQEVFTGSLDPDADDWSLYEAEKD